MAERETDGLARLLAVAGLVTALAGLFFNYREIREKDRDRELQLMESLYGIRQLIMGSPGAAWFDLEPFNLPREGDAAEELQSRTHMALLLSQDDADALSYRGVYFLKVGKPDKAIDSFRQALAGGRSPQAHKYLSVAYQRSDRWEEAEVHARRAIDLDPNDPGAYNALGKVMSKREEWDDVLGQYRIAVEKDPTYYPSYNNIGYITLRRNDTNGAIEAFRRALHFNPNSAMSYTNLGLALEMQGDLDEAVMHYRRATEVNPIYVNGYIALAEALLDKDERGEAMDLYRLAKQLSPQVKSRKLEALRLSVSGESRSSAPNPPLHRTAGAAGEG